MKNKLMKFLFVSSLCCMMLNCTKESSAPSDSKGTISFWASNSAAAVYPISISVDGSYVGSIGGRLSSKPDCSDYDKTVKFQNGPGIYNLVAKSANGGNWTGSFTITSGQCITRELQ